MFIEIPDEHPGRCRNQRVVFVNGYPETLRCLDYEAVQHVCAFPEPPLRVASVTYTLGGDTKKAWVRP
jgi:hypothetical protein